MNTTDTFVKARPCDIRNIHSLPKGRREAVVRDCKRREALASANAKPQRGYTPRECTEITFNLPLTVRVYGDLPKGVSREDAVAAIARGLNYYEDGHRLLGVEVLEATLPGAVVEQLRRANVESVRTRLGDAMRRFVLPLAERLWKSAKLSAHVSCGDIAERGAQ